MQTGMKHFLISLLAFYATAGEAQAVTWGNAPLACLPGRAVIWNNGSVPELCHCPPQSMCPTESASSVTAANVSFNVNVSVQIHDDGTGDIPANFILSGTDVANYYNSAGPATFHFTNYPTLSFTTPGFPQSNSPYTPFDPTQIFVMADNVSYSCPTGYWVLDSNYSNPHLSLSSQTWGAIPDYLTPLVRQYLTDNNINWNIGVWPNADSFCSLYLKIIQYAVTVTVSDSLAAQITNATQVPPALVNSCCPQQNFTCPQGASVQIGKSNSASCQETVNTARLGCLLEGTPVLAADGKNRKVEDIKLGDHLKGEHGEVSVIAINKFTQSADEMYSFNGGKAFITSEHPILTTRGWKSIAPQFTTVKSGIGPVGKLSVGDEIVTRTGTLKITSIEKHAIKAPATAYNLSVQGGDGFIANDVVVKGFSQVEIHY